MLSSAHYTQGLAIVVIGRNEGPRLRRCLRGLKISAYPVVYVDSGSTDGSADFARAFGADVVMLDDSAPFTAARARNAGAERICKTHGGVRYVQFVDGDCELLPGWLETGVRLMDADSRLGLAAGRVRERRPDASVYNRLCDLEWSVLNQSAGISGGNCLVRLAAFEEAGGFDARIVAGEEPEFCRRLRRHGWQVRSVPVDMVRHDANLRRFGAWWRRMVRGGRGIAAAVDRDGWRTDTWSARELRSVLLWAVGVPGVAVATAWPSVGLSLLLIPAAYGAQWWRIADRQARQGWSRADARLYAAFLLLGKFAELTGAGLSVLRRMARPGRLRRRPDRDPIAPQFSAPVE